MQKPIKPLRPGAELPSKIKETELIIIERDGKLDLKPINYEDQTNWYDGVFDKRIYDFIGRSLEPIGLCFPVDNFEIFLQDYCHIVVKLYTKKSDEIYNQELIDFENRFENYKAAMLEYEDDLKVYEEWSRAERIKKLTEAIAEINNFNGNKS